MKKYLPWVFVLVCLVLCGIVWYFHGINAAIALGTAIGTMTLAIVAICGNMFRAWFACPELRLEVSNDIHCLKTGHIYTHLKIINASGFYPAKNCTVVLRAIAHQTASGEFDKPKPVSCPIRLAFPFEKNTQISAVTVQRHDCQYVDFGVIDNAKEENSQFKLLLEIKPLSLIDDICLQPGEARQFYFQITADDYLSDTLYGSEVHWRGGWDGEPDNLTKFLEVKPCGTKPLSKVECTK